MTVLREPLVVARYGKWTQLALGLIWHMARYQSTICLDVADQTVDRQTGRQVSGTYR